MGAKWASLVGATKFLGGKTPGRLPPSASFSGFLRLAIAPPQSPAASTTRSFPGFFLPRPPVDAADARFDEHWLQLQRLEFQPVQQWGNDANEQVGLATSYFSQISQSNTNGAQQSAYTYSTNSSGNLYVGSTTVTQDYGLSSAVKKQTTQTQDQYGNVTQMQQSSLYTSGSPTWVRAYTNTCLNNSNYTNLHIVNRLTGSTVTEGTNTSTLSSITYDGDNSNFTAAPGITAHDSAYTCNYGQTGCTCRFRRRKSLIPN